MNIYNWQTQRNHWNTIVTRGVMVTLLFTPWLALPKCWLLNFGSSYLETKKDRNKQILDSDSRHLDDCIWLRRDSIYTSNIHVQSHAQKHCFIYTCTTLSYNLRHFCGSVVVTLCSQTFTQGILQTLVMASPCLKQNLTPLSILWLKLCSHRHNYHSH